jgi:hypothetical protein
METEVGEKMIHSDLGQQFERVLATGSNRGKLRLWDRAENSVPTLSQKIPTFSSSSFEGLWSCVFAILVQSQVGIQ